ncbi:glycosyltransferase family 4 protein [Sunxiuqinia sp. sy24]|uniref:glycosyltransferase family 4 protein n=1 Tax=Sunxiuqinia sp. sy24 TaxID=3461495 RepID=UPI004046314A
MKILNISTIIPLKGLPRDNDIILQIQDYLKNKYNYQFIIAKSLPFSPSFLGLFSQKWKKYSEYTKQKKLKIYGYNTLIYSWLAPPTSNLWIYYFLIPLNYLWYNFKIKKQLSNFANDTDLIVTQSIFPDALYGYWLAKRLKKPYVVNIRNGIPSIFKLFPLSRITKNAFAIITPSPLDYKKFKDQLNIQLIPHPINDSFFTKEKQSTNLSTIKIVSVCRLLDLKHIDWVINTLALIKSKGFSFQYNIIGDGPETEKLKTLTKTLKLNENVIFHGYQTPQYIKQYLVESHIFIMPSYPEALGIAFLEAAASNCLIVGHKNSGVDGLLIHKHSAIFVDKNSITDEILHIFNHISPSFLKQYNDNARRIVDKIKWNRIGELYHNLYSK